MQSECKSWTSKSLEIKTAAVFKLCSIRAYETNKSSRLGAVLLWIFHQKKIELLEISNDKASNSRGRLRSRATFLCASRSTRDASERALARDSRSTQPAHDLVVPNNVWQGFRTWFPICFHHELTRRGWRTAIKLKSRIKPLPQCQA